MEIGCLVRRYVPVFGAVLMIALISGATGCSRIKYPNCENDSHCAEQGEYCVNGMCQQCRETAHCPEGQQCQAGRCEPIPGFCRAEEDCAAGQKCRNNRCGPECISNEECGENERCQGGRCVPAAECYGDDDCPGGMACESGKCVRRVVRCSPERVHFDFDSNSIRADMRNVLEEAARCLRSMNNPATVIEGHADERGTEEYNLALGERRARAVQQYLERMGVSNLRVVSYGKNRPLNPRNNEQAWSENRRAEFRVER